MDKTCLKIIKIHNGLGERTMLIHSVSVIYTGELGTMEIVNLKHLCSFLLGYTLHQGTLCCATWKSCSLFSEIEHYLIRFHALGLLMQVQNKGQQVNSKEALVKFHRYKCIP